MCAERSIRAAWLAVLLAGALAGPVAAAAEPADALPPTWFHGWLLPGRAEWIRVPDLGDQPLVLERIAAEGASLKAGAEVAAIAFDQAGQAGRLEQQLRTVEAHRERALARLSDQLERLRARLALAELEAAKAELEKKKTGVLSRRDAELVELGARQAAFEVDGLKRRVEVQQAILAATRAEQDERVRQARAELEALAQRAARHRLLAARPGRVWLQPVSATQPADGPARQARPADPLSPGQVLAALYNPGVLELRFWVPEALAAGFRPGRAIAVQSLSGQLETFARVTGTAPFATRGPGDGQGQVQVFAELPADARGFEPGQPVRVGP